MINPTVLNQIFLAALDDVITKVDDIDLDSYLQFAKAQQVEALLIQGLIKMKYPVPQNVMHNLWQHIIISTNQMYVASELYNLFNKNKIDFLPLKGCLMKPLYPSADMRSMGDIDILIKKEQYNRIRDILNNNGYIEHTESEHELIWQKNNYIIELHKSLIPINNKDYYSYYGDGWKLAKITNDGFRYEMSPEDTFVYMFTHYAKHYRETGVGIRQAIDLYIYCKHYCDMDKEYIRNALVTLQLDRFYENTMHMLDVWFGNETHTEGSRIVEKHLYDSGVFGTSKNRQISTMLRNLNSTGSMKKARFLVWKFRVLLPYYSMCKEYPILKKYPVLLPCMWIVRAVTVFLHKRGKIQYYKQADEDISISDIAEYSEMLKKSGLYYNY